MNMKKICLFQTRYSLKQNQNRSHSPDVRPTFHSKKQRIVSKLKMRNRHGGRRPDFKAFKNISHNHGLHNNIQPLSSQQKKKKKRERGSPWRNPLSKENSSVGLPLTKIEAVAVETHSLIHFLQRTGNDILSMTASRYPQSTESYAFSKSTLNNKSSLLNLDASSTTSFAIRIPSRICLLRTKADCSSDTTVPITWRNLLARTFAKTL